MKLLVTAAQMGAIERASAMVGVSTHALMANAGAALAEEALRLASPRGRFLIVCGRGNNGGDGLVAARRLGELGREVHCELLPGVDARMPEEARAALAALRDPPAPIPADLVGCPGDVVIDALLGTGLSRAPEGAYAEAIARIAAWRATGAAVLAADVPSGLAADSGQPHEPCVQADATVCFGHLKVGLAVEPGVTLAGVVKSADIGLPVGTAVAAPPPLQQLLEEEDARGRLPRRRADSHKGSYGHVLVVAGSHGKSGAAALAAKAALRSGAGLVSVATRASVLDAVLAHAPELMGLPLDGDDALGPADAARLIDAARGKQALVIGPGIPRGDHTGELIGALLEASAVPTVLDADALNAIAGDLSVLARARAPVVLTPHPGEMARLSGQQTAEVQRDRIAAARALATAHRVVVILKGARTLIAAPDGALFVNPTGNAGMATAGSGDVLSGMIGALLAQGLSAVDAAVVGVYAHGLAGDRAARLRGQLGLIASDLLETLGEVWTRWNR